MKKLAKFITFVGLAGAALAGLWYFLDSRNNNLDDEAEDTETEAEEKEEEPVERSYVSLNTDDASDKEALTKVVTEAVKDSIAKADEKAEGIGVVKDESAEKANDFEFKSFDEKKED